MIEKTMVAAVFLIISGAGLSYADTKIDRLVLDRATLIELPDEFSSIVVGQPALLTLTLSETGAGILTGKGYGETNIIFLNKEGGVVEERIVRITSQENVVSVSGVSGRKSYSCSPRCESLPLVGDAQEEYSKVMGQFQQANAFSSSASSAVSGQGKIDSSESRQKSDDVEVEKD